MPIYYNLLFEPPIPGELASYLEVLLHEQPEGKHDITYEDGHVLADEVKKERQTFKMTGCTELDLQDFTDRLTTLIRFWEIEGHVTTGRILCFTGSEDLLYLYIMNEEIIQKRETVKVTNEKYGLRLEMADDLQEDLSSIFAAYGSSLEDAFYGFICWVVDHKNDFIKMYRRSRCSLF